MGNEKVEIVTDTREPGRVATTVLMHDDIMDWRAEQLPVGDLLFPEAGVVVERKTVGDFASSIKGARFENQLEKLEEVDGQAYILVDLEEMEDVNPEKVESLYEMGYMESDMPVNSIRGFSASVMSRRGIPVIPCWNNEELVDLAVRLARKSVEEERPRLNPNSDVQGTDEPYHKRAFGCLDGVGSTRAERLSERFDSISQIINLGPQQAYETVQELPNFGSETAAEVVEQLWNPGVDIDDGQ